MGRSGTKFLSELLKMDNEVLSNHEDIGSREYWLLSHYLEGEFILPFLEREKKRIDQNQKKIYLDVNSYLQNSGQYLPEIFDNCIVFHLVRNPKKVVPSIYSRRDDTRIHKTPKIKEQIEKWLNMTKLEQICFNWNQTTNQLLAENHEILQFEKIVSDYDYIKTHFLDKIGATITQEQYNDFKSKKINKTRNSFYRFLYSKIKNKPFIRENGKFTDLSKEDQTKLFSICGETMKKLGYL